MKNIEINERMNERDSVASIGIGAMIVFIALILVAAVASAVIIQTGEKLQQNAQQTGADTQQEIGGKISVIAVWVGDQSTGGSEDVTLIFETAAGSEPITATSVGWTIVCADNAGTDTASVGGTFAAATELDAATAAGTAGAPFTQGNVYMIDLLVGTTNGWAGGAAECIPDAGEEHILIIMVAGGGTTYETLSYNSVDEGATVV
jgi:flagellin FlaB